VFLYRNEHIAILVAIGAAVGNPLAFRDKSCHFSADAKFCGFPDGEAVGPHRL
jgi:hypothetical protein